MTMREKTWSRLVLAAFVVIVLLRPPASDGGEIEGVTFAEQHQVGAINFKLHGVGLLRYRLVIKAYVAALYLGEGVQADAVLTDTPKRLELEYFWSIAGPDFGKAANHILEANLSAATLFALRSRLDRLHALYETVKPGDRYALTYLPGAGTELTLNGVSKGVIDGADFASAYFAIWLGEKPIDRSLKTQLLAPLPSRAGLSAPTQERWGFILDPYPVAQGEPSGCVVVARGDQLWEGSMRPQSTLHPDQDGGKQQRD